MNNKIKIALLTALLMLLASSAWAADPGRGPGAFHGPEGMGQAQLMAGAQGPGARGPEGAPSKERMEKIRKRIEMIKMWRLTEEFNEETAAKLFPLVSRFDRKRMELQREMFELWRDIRQKGAGADDSGALLDKLEKLKAAMRDLEEEQSKELKKILTPEEMLRYLAFEERFRQEMQQLLRESRSQRPGGPGMGGPGGPGMGGPGGPGMGGPGGPGMGGPGGPGMGGPGGMNVPQRSGPGMNRQGYPSRPIDENY